MKRKLAVLLALSLSIASVPYAGGYAAETEQTAVVETAEESTEIEEAVAAATEEAAAEEEPEEVAAVEEAIAADTAEVAAPVEEETEEAVTVEENTEEIAAEGTTEAAEEIAAEEEQVVEETAPEEAVVEEVSEEAEAVETAAAAAVEEIPAAKAAVTVKETATELNKVSDGIHTISGNKYYYKNGVKQTGLITISGKGTYYFMDKSYVDFDPAKEGQMMTGWKTVNGAVRYFTDEKYKAYKAANKGKMLTGWKTIGGRVYFLADSRVSGYEKGEQVTGWQKIDGKMYYFADENYKSAPRGSMLTGFKTISGSKYYFADSRYKSARAGSRLTGWKTIGGKKYYFIDSKYAAYKPANLGKMATGIKTISGKYYYFNSHGVRQTGWVKTTKGLMAYYTENGTAGKTGWKAKDGDWYYLTKNGQARTGWMKLNSTSIFYLDGTQAGKMLDMPKKIGDKVYYFGEDGRRATTRGWKSSGGYYYYTYTNGTCAVNTTIEGIKLDKDGKTELNKIDVKAQGYSSDTNYLIMVDKTTYSVCVYKGRKGNWVRIKGVWGCTHGGSNTPEGEKHIVGRLTKRSAEYGWGDFTYTSAAFCMQLSSGNFFHSILYDKYSRTNPYNLEPTDDSLYQNYSHGCIRLKTENAEWIWDNIPAGTAVIVYRS